ncbi:Toxin [Pseudomonas sp. IT-347P]|uniref:dermonecrotic toxin domain-containing protein n=1 Tax=Pseudomonas sp. IT-347P TaxID=3026458 RepID=UPI0039E0F3DD
MSFAGNVSNKKQFESVSEEFLALEQALKVTPSFRLIMKEVMREALYNIAPKLPLEQIFVNARRTDIPGVEPTGLLNEILIECVVRGRAPLYDSSQYGLYGVHGSTNEKDRIVGFDVAAAGLLIGEVIGTLAQRCSSALQRHWIASPGNDAFGRKLPPRNVTLRNAYAKLFWEELRVTVQVNGVIKEVEESLNVFLRDQPQAPVYGIALQLEDNSFSTLDCCFVQRLDGQFSDELVSVEDDWVILYTPSGGLEVFRTAALLQQEIEQRLSRSDSCEQLLKGAALEDAKLIRGVPVIRYPKVKGELFQASIDNVLRKQQRDYAFHVRQLNEPGEDLEAILDSIDFVQMLEGVSNDGKARMAKLLAQFTRDARPQWLKDSSSTNQEVFTALEKQLFSSEIALHSVMGGLSSLHEYARGVVGEHISRGQSQPVDPDAIWVSVKQSVPIGTKKIDYIERKTLTQLFTYGLHDDAARYSLKVEGTHDNSRLSVANIEYAVRQFDLRLDYARKRGERLNDPQVRETMRELMSQQIALSNFAAILQKHISPSAQNIMQRYLFGDSTMEAGGLAFRSSYRPMRDMIVFRAKGALADNALHVLYAPGAPAGQHWYEFPDLRALKRQFSKWGFEPLDRDFLINQCHSSNRRNLVESYLSFTELAPIYEQWWWGGVTFVPWTQAPLINAVDNLIDWEISEEQTVTPDWYRNATNEDRARFTRLNTEFKAIAQVAKRPLYIQTLNEFSRERVMHALNGYLSLYGPNPYIDPDRVRVKLRGHDYMTLTNLFIQWQVWTTSDPVHFYSLDNAPLGRLDASVVSALIDLRPGVKYEQYLRERFVNASDKELKAKLYCKTVQNEMFRLALTQKMQGTLSPEDYDWLNGQIAELDHDRVSTADPVYRGTVPKTGIYTLALEGLRVEGAYTFGRYVAGRYEFVVYIPKAPDGLSFRPIGSLTEGLRRYALGNHLVRLVRIEDRAIMQRFVERCRAASGPALATPELRDSFPVVHFRQEYDSMVQRLLYDLDHQTTTQGELFWRHVLIGVELVVDVISLFVPPVGLAASVVRITRSIVQGVIAYNRGDEQAGKAHLASAWRSATLLYVGFVAGMGASSSAVGLLTRIKDLSDILSTATGVPVGIDYVSAVAAPQLFLEGVARIVD